jgi:mannose-6-phosphate isomerase-like protein (cupin superfamily)
MRKAEMSPYDPINFETKFERLSEQWSPRVIAEMNDYQFKIARLQGDFVWHHHPDTDETFIVLDGHLRIDFRDGAVDLKAGEMFVVPKRGRAQTVRGRRDQAASSRAAWNAKHG